MIDPYVLIFVSVRQRIETQSKITRKNLKVEMNEKFLKKTSYQEFYQCKFSVCTHCCELLHKNEGQKGVLGDTSRTNRSSL